MMQEIVLNDVAIEDVNTGKPIGLDIRVSKQGVEIEPSYPDYANGEGWPVELFLEFYEGRLQVHVWTGMQEDPVATIPLLEIVGTDDEFGAGAAGGIEP